MPHAPSPVPDEVYMRRALELAERGRYSTSPNPMVGCVIVRDGVIIGEGFHERAGEPHAEVNALRAANDVRGATMYVTLEPCSRHGRTPPCIDAIRDAGLARVVVAMRDPNQQPTNMNFEFGVLEAEARRLNEVFVWSKTNKLPFVILKAAMTLDGKLVGVERRAEQRVLHPVRQRLVDDGNRRCRLRVQERRLVLCDGHESI